jgi:transposase
MFLRHKITGNRHYLQIVESYRDNGKPRQRILATLGRLEDLRESGQLERLLASGARLSEKLSVIGAHKRGELSDVATRKIGPLQVFGRLWHESGVADCMRQARADRRFRFDLERVIMLAVIHRLIDPGSDRATEKWCAEYLWPDEPAPDLQHFYRAMAWLGEPLPETEQQDRLPFSPRCTKDLIEEELFARRRDLFSGLSMVLFDTTSLYFEGEGGETIGQRGHSKDHRPDLKQMVVGLVIDADGRPICCELWPGNTTDVTTVLPLVGRLRNRFGISRICVVADRGMISQKTISALEAEGLQYILGARLRKHKEVRDEVLSCPGRYRVVRPARSRAKDPAPLKIKQVEIDGRRYIVCLNEEQARKDAHDRQQIVAKLETKLREGAKSLVGNKGYRKYLKSTGSRFELDAEKIKSEARFDGKWVLRTNSDLDAESVALAYKSLWMVEDLFRSLKSVLSTRPIYHKSDAAIRGHVFCSFLALVLMCDLQERMAVRGWYEAEWSDVLRDLDGLTETQVTADDGKRFVIRSESRGWCGKTYQAAGVAMSPTLRMVPEVKTE